MKGLETQRRGRSETRARRRWEVAREALEPGERLELAFSVYARRSVRVGVQLSLVVVDIFLFFGLAIPWLAAMIVTYGGPVPFPIRRLRVSQRRYVLALTDRRLLLIARGRREAQARITECPRRQASTESFWPASGWKQWRRYELNFAATRLSLYVRVGGADETAARELAVTIPYGPPRLS